MDKINKRKEEHIQFIVNNKEVYRNKKYFDDILLNYLSLPEINMSDIDTCTTFLNKALSFPFMISPMTGGSSEMIININKNLAKAAEETNVAMQVGSQRIMFIDKNAEESFKLRDIAKNVPLIANFGAVQLNYDFGLEHCKKMISILNADAICLHVNPLQEAIQSNGDTNFKNLLQKIKELKNNINIPIIIKDVGNGMSVDTVKQLQKIGIKYIDIAGSGGTSFAYIEGLRSNNDIGNTFKDFGIPTPLAITNIKKHVKNINITASGGLQNGLDIAKALILGANMSAIAKPLLECALISDKAVIEKINQYKKELQITMFVLGKTKIKDIIGNKKLILK